MIDELLASLNNQKGETLKSSSDALKVLKKFAENPSASSFKPGDRIERNLFGQARYKYPQDNQVMIVVEVLDEPILDDESNYCDMVVAVALSPTKVSSFPVNARYYDKTGKSASNIIEMFTGGNKK